MSRHGPVWFDPAIRSTYVPRASFRALARQFFRYGRSRCATVRRHPGSLQARQLAAPVLLLGLASPWRAQVATAYALIVAGRVVAELPRDPSAAPGIAVALPTMHVSWALGFLLGAVTRAPAPRVGAASPASGRTAALDVPAA